MVITVSKLKRQFLHAGRMGKNSWGWEAREGHTRIFKVALVTQAKEYKQQITDGRRAGPALPEDILSLERMNSELYQAMGTILHVTRLSVKNTQPHEQ